MLLVSEAPAPPISVTHELTSEGNIGALISREGEQDNEIVVEREIEVGLIMTLEVANRMSIMLKRFVDGLSAAQDEGVEDTGADS